MASTPPKDRTRTEAPRSGSSVGTDATLPATPTPAPAPAAPSARGVLAPVARDRYDIGPEIARGGMGRILSVHDLRLDRPVAIKELIASDPGLARRFEREALITARLQHPSIVSLYEAGRWPDGEPFYVMKLVRGRSLKEVVAEARGLNQRLALLPQVIAIAEALAYAHAERIVHRDLKPSNVLVGDYGETVVIDWGLAKDLTRDEDDADPLALRALAAGADLTVAGSIMGTPGYMAPEQAEGKSVDERADVYAIGAILYFVLAGAPPYEEASSTQMLMDVRQSPPTPVRERQPAAPLELVAVVERAMARDPKDRYPSARELAEELRRFQTGQLVAAYRYTRAQLARRWMRRYRTSLSVVAAVIAAGVVAGGAAVTGIVRERDRAEEAQRRATERADRLTLSEARTALERDPARALEVLGELSPQSNQWGAARMVAAEALDRGLPRALRGHKARVTALAVAPDGRIASGGADGSLWMWDAAAGTGREIGRHPKGIEDLVFAPVGRALASLAEDGSLRVWDDAGSRELASGVGGANQLEFSPDGRALFVAGAQGVVRYDVTGGTPTRLGEGGLMMRMALSPDGSKVALFQTGTTFSIQDTSTGSARPFRGHEDLITHAAFSPDGRILATASRDQTIRLWDPSGRRPPRVLTGHGDAVVRLAFSPDGKVLASASRDSTVRLWTVDTAEGVVLAGQTDVVHRLCFSRDGKRLATASADRTVRVYDVATRAERVLHAGDATPDVAFLPDGATLVTIGRGATVSLWDLNRASSRTLPGELVVTLAMSPARPLVASSDLGSTLRITDLATGDTRVPGTTIGVASEVAFSPDGRLLATLGIGATAELWQVDGGAPRSLPGFVRPPVVFSPDGRRLAAVGQLEKTVVLWDVAAGTGSAWSGHSGWVSALAFSPDGRLLASGAQDNTVRLWHLDEQKVRVLAGHDSPVSAVAFSPDGRVLASADRRSVRLWRLATGGTDVLRHDAAPAAIAFTPDGRLLATTDGSVLHLWDVATGRDRRLAAHAAGITHLALAGDGRTLVTADPIGLRQWDVASGESRELARFDKRAPPDGLVLSVDGRTAVVVQEDRLHVYRDDVPDEPEALRSHMARALAGAHGD